MRGSMNLRALAAPLQHESLKVLRQQNFIRISKDPENHMHLRWTMVGPASSYSALEIHICWKVVRDERMEPPIQTLYFLSGGVITLILTVEGARALSSLVMRSPMPGNIVEPPESTTLEKRSRRMSTSHFLGFEPDRMPSPIKS